jgi:integrase
MPAPTRYVHQVAGPDGETYLYLRKRGLPHLRLHSAPGSPELTAEVAALLRLLEPARIAPNTLAAALREYELRDPNFANLASSTKYEYRLILKELDEDFGALALAAIDAGRVQALRNLWAPRGHRAANVRLQVLKNVLKPAFVARGLERDPFAMVAQVRRPHDAPEPHVIWPAEAVEVVFKAAVAEQRFGLARAVAIARYAGARRGDLVRLPRTARQEGGRFVFLSGKRKVRVDAPEDPELTRLLDATPDAQPLSPWQAAEDRRRGVVRLAPTTLVYNRSGRPYSEDGLGLELSKLVARLAKAGRLPHANFDWHGLRHTRGVEAALAGCTDAQGAALMGHASPHAFAVYRRQAERVRLGDDAAAKILALRAEAQIAPADGRNAAAEPIQNAAIEKCKKGGKKV